MSVSSRTCVPLRGQKYPSQSSVLCHQALTSLIQTTDPIEAANSAEAIMDVIAYCDDGTEYLIDVSARNPLANRYKQVASTRPGYACGRGEYDKQRRYPRKGGKQVMPCIVESFGRIGDNS